MKTSAPMSFKQRRQAWAEVIERKLGPIVGALPPPGAPLSAEAAAMPPPPPVRVIDRVGAKDISPLQRYITEADFQQQVEQMAGLFKWTYYHTYDARNSEAGFPDLVLIRPPRLVVAELKKIGEEPKPEQLEWLRLFQLCGAETFVWRPSDIDQVLRVLK